jgi:hypothetical protein
MLDSALLMVPDYGLAYTLVGLFLLLGILAICFPRPRKSEIPRDND